MHLSQQIHSICVYTTLLVCSLYHTKMYKFKQNNQLSTFPQKCFKKQHDCPPPKTYLKFICHCSMLMLLHYLNYKLTLNHRIGFQHSSQAEIKIAQSIIRDIDYIVTIRQNHYLDLIDQPEVED